MDFHERASDIHSSSYPPNCCLLLSTHTRLPLMYKLAVCILREKDKKSIIMVSKISNGEYLKRFDNMTAAERSEYLGRVGNWLSVDGQCLMKNAEVFEAQLQNVLQMSACWNDQECRAFEDGVVLLSAQVAVADTKLPDILYSISAKRSIRNIFRVLRETEAGNADEVGKRKDGEKEAANVKDSVRNDNVRMQAGEAKEALFGVSSRMPNVAPPRPRHFDQYAHLLPQKTQERIAKYGPLMRELDEAREKLRLLIGDVTATAAQREAWAKRISAIDKEIGSIRREADREWDKLVKEGRVMLDDLGNARVVEDQSNQSAPGNPTELTSEQKAATKREEGEADFDSPEWQEAQSKMKARRRELRKWLVDTRRGNGNTREEHVRKWTENFREYLALEGDKAFEDERIKEAIGHYGIDVEKLKNDSTE